MRTVQAQAVWEDEFGVWSVLAEPGIGAVSQAYTVNGARKNIREAIEVCLGGEPFELDFRVHRWFDEGWSPEEQRTRVSRRKAALSELAREARSGSPEAIDEFVRTR